ncbi:MAG: twin-arginine translocation signal domain-containing protein [Saprospirales bacterium]|nr:twin-arginine translocation signal domain-containing protein [Saprospirales bacterium]
MSSFFSRRRFLKTSLLATAALPLAGRQRLFPSPPPEHIGLQLYSLRDAMAKDPLATLKAVSEIGYREVEAYNYNAGKLFGFAYETFGKILQDNGLLMYSTHAGISLADYVEKTGDISDTVKKWVDAAPALGLRYVISPSINEAEWPQMGKLVKLYQAMGRYCKRPACGLPTTTTNTNLPNAEPITACLSNGSCMKWTPPCWPSRWICAGLPMQRIIHSTGFGCTRGAGNFAMPKTLPFPAGARRP